LTALLPSGVKTAKWQLTRVKRCRSKPPSFPPGQPTCHGMCTVNNTMLWNWWCRGK